MTPFLIVIFFDSLSLVAPASCLSVLSRFIISLTPSAGSGTVTTAGTYSQLSIATHDAFGNAIKSGGQVAVAHVCRLGISNEHGKLAHLLPFVVCLASTMNSLIFVQDP